MAAGSIKFHVWFITFIYVSICVKASSSSQCTDGTYRSGELDCCQCAAGTYVTKHCITNQTYGTCEPCGTDTYKSHPDSQMTCDPCTPCSHPNENLEEAEPCTPASDRKCRCKKDHYCATDFCRPCHPCTKCGEEGIKVPCAGKSDTVCNEKTEGGSSTGLIVGIIVPLFVLAGVVGIIIWRKKKRQAVGRPQENGNPNDVAIDLIEDVDLQPHLIDIAKVIGWKDMKGVARRSQMPTTAIEDCEQNHPSDAEERTYELLKKWVESQGSGASRNLVEILLRNDKRDKANRVKDILAGRLNVPV